MMQKISFLPRILASSSPLWTRSWTITCCNRLSLASIQSIGNTFPKFHDLFLRFGLLVFSLAIQNEWKGYYKSCFTEKIFSCLGEITSLTFGLCAQNVFEVKYSSSSSGWWGKLRSRCIHWKGVGVWGYPPDTYIKPPNPECPLPPNTVGSDPPLPSFQTCSKFYQCQLWYPKFIISTVVKKPFRDLKIDLTAF